jgi:small-conductance mechanosensitive channel
LNWLNIPLTIFAFLAGALAIGVGFGTQTIIKNFISGIILLFERKVRVGDIIEVDGINGVVSEINTRSSIVRGFNGIENLIPNSLFLENRVVNWTLNNRLLRRELTVRVALGSPSQKIIEILGEVADRHGLILKTPAPIATFSHFGDNSIDFSLYFWVELNDKTNGLVVDSDLRLMIEKRFDELDIHSGITRVAPAAEATREPGESALPSPSKPEVP